MVYILIWFLSNTSNHNAVATGSAEFNTKTACEKAGKNLPDVYAFTTDFICVQKGEVPKDNK